MSEATTPTFEPQWGIVEIMGHNRFAGMISERSVFGTVMCQVDVPEMPEYVDEYERTRPSQPGYTKLFGGSSIYAITPTDEATAKAAARRNSAVLNVYIPELNPMPPRRLAILSGDEEEGDDLPEDVFHDQ